MRDPEREAETQAEGEAGPRGSPMRDSILGLQDHALGRRQTPNHWATQASLNFFLLITFCEWNSLYLEV